MEHFYFTIGETEPQRLEIRLCQMTHLTLQVDDRDKAWVLVLTNMNRLNCSTHIY